MKKFLCLVLVLSFSLVSKSQELSLIELFNKTQQVFALIEDGNQLSALDVADETIDIYKDYKGREQYFTYLYIYKAEAYLTLGDIMLARYCDSLALKYALKSGNSKIIFTIKNNLAVLDLEREDYQRCLETCISIVEDSNFSPNLDQKAMIQNNMALCALKTGSSDAAISLFADLLVLANSQGRFENYDPAITFRNYGIFMQQQGLYSSACDYFNLALEWYIDSLGKDHYQTGQTLLYLGDCYRLMGSTDSALLNLNRAVEVLDPVNSLEFHSQNVLTRIRAYKARAEFWYSQSKYEKALEDLEEAITRIDFVM